MEYLEWNNLIAKHFFNEEKAGKEVLLYVNDEILKEIGRGAGVDDFIKSIKTGPQWASHSSICQKALQAFEGWRRKGLDYPPYISYLAFFVLAAVTETDYASYSYYPGFWKRLNESQDSGTPPSFDRMIALWDDLERWSTEDKHEELGRFTAWIRGSWWKVGLPWSQTIISKDEQKHLPAFFEAAGLDPSAPPSPQVVLKLMLYHGSGMFEKRTIRVLNKENGEDVILKNKLTEMVLDELQEWDGAVPMEEGTEEAEQKLSVKINSGLRICMKYKPLAEQVITSIRLKANRAYPESGLKFKCREFPEESFYCEEEYQCWSKKLKKGESEIFDATALNWVNGAYFEDNDSNWHAVFKGGTVRLFVSGTPDGLPGWIETNRLDRGIIFFVATYGEVTNRVCDWGNKCCESFTEFNVTGLPQGWTLLKGQNASESCDDIDVLTVSSTVRLLLRGGVKIRGGNTYLYTAPPHIVLENATGNINVTVNGNALKRETGESSVWKLPEDIQPNEVLRIEAKARDWELKKILRLEEPSLSGSFEEAPWRDIKGMVISNGSDQSRIRGAVVETAGANTPSPVLGPDRSKRQVFIGSIPGEITEWPKEPFPAAWKPVWAIEKRGRKKWKISCCREDINSIPLPDVDGQDIIRKNVKKWKKYVWIRRKKIEKPEIPAIEQKWLDFSGGARNV